MDGENPKPRQKPGPKPGSDGARRTGFAADPERARGAGQAGAARAMERYRAAHYQQLGRTGGRKLMEAHGAAYFAAIGRLGSGAKKERAQEDAGLLARVARLLGAAEALRAKHGMRVPLVEQSDYASSVAAAQAGLGVEGFAAAWADGQAMSLDEAVALALGADEG